MLFTNATIATMKPGSPYGLIADAALLTQGEEIVWVGSQDSVPSQAAGHERIDLQGMLVTPGMIDCHTHVVFGGNRAREFEMRLEGKSYEEVARAGGGIVSTVAMTRIASEQDLVEAALPRVDALMAEGVTSLEIKSGYGLEIESELRMLRAARAIGRRRAVDLKTTFLGAHCVPQEFKGRNEDYLAEVCIPALRLAHQEGLVDAIDGFCERIGFTAEQLESLFEVAQELGLPVKLHAEQLTNSGGVQLASRYGAVSVDHLEYAGQDDVLAMKEAGSVAVLLPGAFYTIRETQVPPVELLRAYEVPMAIATDCNPGSSPMTSLLLAMNMGCTLFRMTPEEALRGVTCHAAQALQFTDRGTLEGGKRADLAIWKVSEPAELAYRIGFNPLHARVFGGVIS